MKLKKLLLPITFLVLITSFSLGQNTFEKNFSGTNLENINPRNIQSIPDDGIAMVGTRMHNGIENVFLSKLNQQGDTLWMKYYSLPGTSISVNDLEVLDDGYIFICDLADQNLSNFIIRTDLNGEINWTKSYSETFPIKSVQIIQSQEGGFMISGTVKSDTDTLKNAVCAIKIDLNGNIEWGKKYNNISSYNFTSNFFNNIGVTQISSNYYLINNENVLKINSIGDTLCTFKVNYMNVSLSITHFLKTIDNNLVLNIKNIDSDAFIKIDTNQAVKWVKRLGYLDNMNVSSFNNTNDGGITIGWYGMDFSNYGNYGISGFSKLDSTGNYNFSFRKNDLDRVSRVLNCQDSSFVFAFKYSAFNLSDFIKTSKVGNTSCTSNLILNAFSYDSVILYPIYQNLITTSAFSNSPMQIQTQRMKGLIISLCDSLSLPTNSDTIYVSACGSYEINNQTYTQSGDYLQIIPNNNGTFDTLSLVLNVIPDTSTTVFITSCTHYQLPNAADCEGCGYIYNSGVYDVYEYQNAAGCDSIIKYDITINNPTISNITLTVCDSFNLDNYHLTNSGLYTLYTYNSIGCDSAINLNLTVLHSTSSSFTDTAYESYTFYNQTYTQSGSYSHSITNSIGCDSIITVDLTIFYIDTSVIVDSTTLFAVQQNASYQWIDCELDSYIPGANAQLYTATENGEYAVQITLENATKITECFTINILGISENQLNNEFEIFPNPFTLESTITFKNPQTNTKVQLYDVLGNELQSFLFSGMECKIKRQELSASMYLVKITDLNGNELIRPIVVN